MGNYEELRHRAMGSRADYQSAAENLKSASYGVTSAWGQYTPSISAYANYALRSPTFSDLGSNIKDYNWGLNLSWTLFDGFATNQSVQTAKSSGTKCGNQLKADRANGRRRCEKSASRSYCIEKTI